ncbi:MAG: DUF3501 family protein [Alphaproteobacteria bacterium]
MSRTEITRDDVMPLAAYEAVRAERRRAMAAVKRNRRVEVGPFATFYFECFATMLHQVQEMLFIEKGGDEQLADELAAYNPLVPKGDELVATVMFEIDDKIRRENVLARLGGIENHMLLTVGGERIACLPEEDVDRTSAAGKASAVQFVHFKFTPAQIAAFRRAGAQVVLGFDHPDYGHMAVVPEAVRAELAGDFAAEPASAA